MLGQRAHKLCPNHPTYPLPIGTRSSSRRGNPTFTYARRSTFLPDSEPCPFPCPRQRSTPQLLSVLCFLLFLLSSCYPEPYSVISLHRTVLPSYHTPCRSKKLISNRLRILLRPHFNVLHVKFLLGASTDRLVSWDKTMSQSPPLPASPKLLNKVY